MGEIANDMMNGLMCSDCGLYFEKEHGYPVLCGNCWKTVIKEGRVKQGQTITTDAKQKHIHNLL